MLRYFVLDKPVGQTPLDCLENYRVTQPQLTGVPLAYAGRLDPMASGKLLILVGDECKKQQTYHGLDKEYQFSVLLDVKSDTGDVLGLVENNGSTTVVLPKLKQVTRRFTSKVTFPYPAYSSKTVQGKPLHTWSVEGRLNEITIPTYTAYIYTLRLTGVSTLAGSDVYNQAISKIDSLPPVIDPRKSLGNDFRRAAVKASWQRFLDVSANQTFHIAHFTCVCESGVYMRTLAEKLAEEMGTVGLAFAIHRSQIGRYHQLPLLNSGWWSKRF